MSFARYALIVLVLTGGSLAALWTVLRPQDRMAVLYGAALAGANTLTAYGLVLWSSRQSTQTFLWTVLGGMVGRMGLMLALVVVGVLALGLPKVPLAISLLSYFVIFLVFELAVLHRRTSPARSEAR